MKNLNFFVAVILLLFSFISLAQDVYERNTSANVQGYVFSLILNDENNKIEGEAIVTVELDTEAETFALDLVGKSGEFGMEISEVFNGEDKASFTHEGDKIKISNVKPGTSIFRIKYQGIAEQGLVIDTTKFGQRSFFGDNWPNLARHWLPCVDHPYDKATIEFRITAPGHYDVVATGEKVEESSLGDGNKLTTYFEPNPVAMKNATIGVTRFATKILGTVGQVPVSAWVYPENRLDGFVDYQVAVKVISYFIENVGPYPFVKLANMQAKTQWGGLENAGTISYFENSVTGKNEVEGLIAHEVAHQWFGNSATENSWNHVWLSEGFATYFATLYLESAYGAERRKEESRKDREEVIEYYKETPSSIVDNSIKDPMKVLSANSYQKGGWALSMLRRQLGDEVFWKGIRAYYKAYEKSNVLTEDFQRVMEEVSGEDLAAFFRQWVYTKGYPELKWSWEHKKNKVIIKVDQKQKHYTFKFPIEFGIKTDGATELRVFQVDETSETFELSASVKPVDIVVDPEVWLLFESLGKK
ncbi:MAG: M1 family aminopeptidase [Cyclobacteriaceae bacterium]